MTEVLWRWRARWDRLRIGIVERLRDRARGAFVAAVLADRGDLDEEVVVPALRGDHVEVSGYSYGGVGWVTLATAEGVVVELHASQALDLARELGRAVTAVDRA